MALKLIGVGFGRTGTNSIKIALEYLGFGPCHHMYEVIDHPEQLSYWQAAEMGKLPNWDTVFKNYGASVDWPSARFWREICSHYSDAKVLLSIRPDKHWIKSIHSTIYPAIRDRLKYESGFQRELLDMCHGIIDKQTFDLRLCEVDYALQVYREHNAEVQRTIARERLLTFDVTEGWGPLCNFLDVPIPDTPFPHTNRTKDFNRSAQKLSIKP